ncbi:MAG: hypothetical protein ACRDX9_17340 [Acidimicrobiia bacterium]
MRTGLVCVEGDREGETEEHLSPILRGVAAMVEGWAAVNEHSLGVHAAAEVRGGVEGHNVTVTLCIMTEQVNSATTVALLPLSATGRADVHAVASAGVSS